MDMEYILLSLVVIFGYIYLYHKRENEYLRKQLEWMTEDRNKYYKIYANVFNDFRTIIVGICYSFRKLSRLLNIESVLIIEELALELEIYSSTR